MRKISKAVAAAGLAAATIVSGLSFGATAAQASNVPNQGRTTLPAQIIFKVGTKYFAENDASEFGRLHNSEAEARAGASTYDWNPQSGLMRDTFDRCLALSGSTVYHLDCEPNNRAFQWSPSSTGGLINASKPTWVVTGVQSGATGTYPEMGLGSEVDFISGLPRFAASVRSGSVDVPNRSAVLDGHAEPGTQVIINDRITAVVKDDGSWSKELTGLKLGKQDVKVEQYKDGQQIGDPITVNVDLAVAPLDIEHFFTPDKNDERVKVFGTADKDATVIVRAATGKEYPTAVGNDGEWQMLLPAPNAGGKTTITVAQRLEKSSGGSDETPQEEYTIDYGRAVSVVAPSEDSGHTGGPVEMNGKGQYGATVTVTEKGKPNQFLGSDKVIQNGTWYIDTTPLDASEHTLIVTQKSKGNNTTTAEVTINPGKNDVAAPTGDVFFSNNVNEKATVRGTGVDGATITLFKGDSNKEIGKDIVAGGEWSTTIDPIGAGDQKIRIEQSGIKDVQTAETTAKYGAAVTLDAPATFADGSMTVTGTSSQGAIVKIVTAGKQVDEFTVTNGNGTFSSDLTGLGSGKITLTATAASRGALTTIAADDATAPIAPESVAMASHVKDGTFEPGRVTFAGRGTVGTTVTLNPFGFDEKYAAYNLTTTTNQWGEWTIQRNLSDTPYLQLAFKQTAQSGVTNQVTNYGLKPFREIGAPGDLQLTNFKAGDFFNPGDQVFSGKATPGATVTLNPFGFDPKYTQYDITTVADAKTGNWEIRRGLAANTLYRELAVKQDPEETGKINKIEKITVAAYGWVGSAADLAVTSHGDKTFTPGTEQTFTGTATAGTTVTLYPFGTAYESFAMTTHVDATGKWTIKRTLGNQVFPMVFTQTEQDGKVNTVDFRMTPAN